MGVMSVPRPKKEKDEERTLVPLTVVQVPRAWVRAHGWPDTWDEVARKAAAGEDGFVERREPRGQLAMDSYRELDLAYLRKGDAGQACLYVQAWRGAA